MSLSQTIVLEIEVPYGRAYGYLSDPRSYVEWAAVQPETFMPLDNGDWAVEMQFGGLRHVRFTPPNEEGVLDHAIFRPGETPLWLPIRARPLEGERTELSFTFIQRPDMTEEAFASTIEWIRIDLLTLKSVLESRFGSRD